MIDVCINKFAVRWQRALCFIIVGSVLAGCSKGEREGVPGSTTKAGTPITQDERTALDAYIAAPDTNYSYHVVSTNRGKDQTSYVLEMTSQAWLTTNEVDLPLWKHWVVIVRPDKVTHSKAMLFISGGSNGRSPPDSANDNLIQGALASHSIVSEVRMVPNQPLLFAGETEQRHEDSLIAYTWDKFLRTGDPKWPARLPMTKAAVRAMDTVTAFCASPEGGKVKVDGFVVAGGSKRGWTTWTTAAVDKRVVAIIPCVADVLNMEPSMLHHYGAYGFWAPAVGAYTAFNLMDWIGTPENRALMKIEEPYQYRHRFTMPKFIINASGDQFFLLDSAQFYFDDLPGVKYLRCVPNADHSLKNTDVPATLTTCYTAILNNTPLPRFSWTMEKDGSIRVTTKDKPAAATLWKATNPNARDFRLETLGPKWENTLLTEQRGGVYIGKVPTPAKGWTAFFVELMFPAGEFPSFKFTTQVRVVPDVLPYKFVPKGRPQ